MNKQMVHSFINSAEQKHRVINKKIGFTWMGPKNLRCHK